MNAPEYIVVHCSDSEWGDAAEIASWHKARGFRTIGYHYVITNRRPRFRDDLAEADGRVETGRAEVDEGAHAPGFNTRSLGICLIGRGVYTEAQMASLHALAADCCRRYRIGADRVIGHLETPSGAAQGKSCPLLDMDALRTEIARMLAPVAVERDRCTHGRTA